MKHNNKKVEVIEMENVNNMNEEVEETGEIIEEEVKEKMSLKKKIMIGCGVVAGLVIGAVALGSRKCNDAEDEIEDNSEDEFDETDSDEIEADSEIAEDLSEVPSQDATEG